MGQYYLALILKSPQASPEVIEICVHPHAFSNGMKLMEHSYLKNPVVAAVESLICPTGLFHMSRIVWAGDYADKETDIDMNLYNMAYDDDAECFKPSAEAEPAEEYRFIVNHSQQLYVDKTKSHEIHPLPLLVCEGNGRGGGDYHSGTHMDLVGTWARDVISMENSVPLGYEELDCVFRAN